MSLVGLLAAVSGRYFALVELVETELPTDVLRNAEMQSTGIPSCSLSSADTATEPIEQGLLAACGVRQLRRVAGMAIAVVGFAIQAQVPRLVGAAQGVRDDMVDLQ